MSNVLIVPETADFEHHVSHRNVVWVTKQLGVPSLEYRKASYLAPFGLAKMRASTGYITSEKCATIQRTQSIYLATLLLSIMPGPI